MIGNESVLAMVPARSGSKGVADKNMRRLKGLSLIAWAGRTLAALPEVDARVLSTDSAAYAEEGKKHGLEVPFLRPAELSGDRATAMDALRHALGEMERRAGKRFDRIILVEPTCPLRRPLDVRACLEALRSSGARSALTLSRLSAKSHPYKVLTLDGERVRPFHPEGGAVTGRQDLPGGLYWRNGAAYAFTRRSVLEDAVPVGDDTAGVVIDRPLANIDDETDFAWAEFLMARETDPHFQV